MGTESGDLLVQEYQLAKQSLTTRPPRAAGVAALRRALGAALLQRRDQFMAQRINDTLKRGETGILFLGMLHSLEQYLDPGYPGDLSAPPASLNPEEIWTKAQIRVLIVDDDRDIGQLLSALMNKRD